MIRTLIVDDEPLARELLRGMLAAEPDISVIGEFDDGRQAVEGIRDLHPDLVFLDIQMPEQNGFQVIESLEPGAIPSIIFVTAYDKYAVQAFEVHALDYLLKPFDEERLSAALRHARERLTRPDRLDTGRRILAMLEQMTASSKYRDHIVIRGDGRAFLQPVREIEWIEASGKHVHIHAGGEPRSMRATMIDLEQKLNPRRFLRVSRSAIVNVDRIREIAPWFNGEFIVTLKSGAQVPSTRGYRQALVDLLDRR
jgi:two-component system, LytTR family, response regulator